MKLRLLSIIVLMSMCRVVFGATVYVDTDAIGANDGSSWADAYDDLQLALTDASLSSGDEIREKQV